MKVGLIDVDGGHFPNFALMKISGYYKALGDSVEMIKPGFISPVDVVYVSKIFTFSSDPDLHGFKNSCIVRGGTGYNIATRLPPQMEAALPDYSIYPQYPFALGFLSRGCIRNCPWCVVPRKEGAVRPVDDIERIAGTRKHVVLMDNNFLANDREFVREQLEKAQRLKLKLDFNQALDARLVTEDNAVWLAKTKWLSASGTMRYIRFSCDVSGMVSVCKRAIQLLRKAGYSGRVFIYFLAKEVGDTLDRILELTLFDSRIDPFVMPYRDLYNKDYSVDRRVKKLARWCNRAAIRKSCSYKEYAG